MALDHPGPDQDDMNVENAEDIQSRVFQPQTTLPNCLVTFRDISIKDVIQDMQVILY